jgi:hypothetical protein
MKRTLAVTLILIGCNAAAESTDPTQRVERQLVTNTADLIGEWCNSSLCLNVEPLASDHSWLIYSWLSDSCSEGGLIQQDANGAFLFGALNLGRECFSHLSEKRYVGVFYASAEGVTVQLSVLSDPIELTTE